MSGRDRIPADVNSGSYRGNARFYRAVTLTFGQQLLDSSNSRQLLVARLRSLRSKLDQETQFLVSILTDRSVECIYHNLCTRKTELALKISTFHRVALPC